MSGANNIHPDERKKDEMQYVFFIESAPVASGFFG